MKLYAVDVYPEVFNGFIINTFLVASATAAVGLRVWARRMRHAKLWLDDYTCMVSLGLLYALYGMQIADAQFGMQTPATDLPSENLTFLLKTFLAAQIFYGAALLFSKASYLFFYRRIFVTEPFLFSVWLLLGLLLAWFLAHILTILLICQPLASAWDPSLASTSVCGSSPAVATALGALNVATSLAIMLLPLKFLRQKLSISLPSQLGLALVYLLSFLAVAIAVVRTLVLASFDFSDVSASLPDALFWTVAEPALLLVTACLPTLRPLISSPSWDRSAELTGDGPGRRASRLPTAGSGGFERMPDDSYPLTDMRDVLHKLQISASLTESEVEGEDGEGRLKLKSRERPKSQCTVTTGGSLKRKGSKDASQKDGLGLGGVTVKTEWAVVEHRTDGHGVKEHEPGSVLG